MDVSDRRRHVQLTQEAEIVPDFFFIRAIFAFAGFGSALAGKGEGPSPASSRLTGRKICAMLMGKKRVRTYRQSGEMPGCFFFHTFAKG